LEELDHDPDAITHEVEIPAFEFEAPTEAPASEAHALAILTTELTTDVPPVLETPTLAQVPAADTGSIEQLVEKISALVDSADTYTKDAVPPPSTPRAIPRPVERPLPMPWVPIVEPPPAGPLSIDSTQTIRALTPLELADDQSSRWFSIQLALSEEPIDPEHVPSLDLFGEYRLYSVTGLDHKRILHSLRLGFFSSELAADAVAGYLRGFFDSPSIKRVSVAERDRFAEQGVTARKDIGETGVHAVIELAGPTLRPERRTLVSVKNSRPAPKASLWSRLISPLKR
jgi:hypothetical protein